MIWFLGAIPGCGGFGNQEWRPNRRRERRNTTPYQAFDEIEPVELEVAKSNGSNRFPQVLISSGRFDNLCLVLVGSDKSDEFR